MKIQSAAIQNSSRRELLRMAGAMPFVSAFAGLPGALLAATDGRRQIAGYDPSRLPTVETLSKWLKQLHEFGPIRMTGTPQCRAFEEFLAQQFAAIGFSTERDQFRLTSWECRITDCSITIEEDSGAKRTVEVVAYYPFGGSTRGKPAATGRVLYVPGLGVAAAKALADATPADVLANSIIVMDMPLQRSARAAATPPPAPLGHFPETSIPRVGGPSPSGQSGREIMEVFENRSKGLIMCYTDVSNETARHNYLPFSDKHRTLPAIWAGAEGSAYLKSVSGKATATIRCDAKLTPDSRADTILATLKGQSDEVVFLTTQTDGPNECNENGGLGVLAVATYWSKIPASQRRRTLVCSLPTAHYAMGAVLDKETGSGRRGGTRGVLDKWPDMAKRIVAQIAMEQMGAMDWMELNGTFAPNGAVAPERWIPTPATQDASAKMFLAATVGEDPRYSNVSVTPEFGAPGEGGSVRSLGIPGIGLMGQPAYFFRADPKGVIDKLDTNVMHNQVSFAAKMSILMDRLSPDQMHGKASISDSDLFG
jgi:hypothetical protein